MNTQQRTIDIRGTIAILILALLLTACMPVEPSVSLTAGPELVLFAGARGTIDISLINHSRTALGDVEFILIPPLGIKAVDSDWQTAECCSWRRLISRLAGQSRVTVQLEIEALPTDAFRHLKLSVCATAKELSKARCTVTPITITPATHYGQLSIRATISDDSHVVETGDLVPVEIEVANVGDATTETGILIISSEGLSEVIVDGQNGWIKLREEFVHTVPALESGEITVIRAMLEIRDTAEQGEVPLFFRVEVKQPEYPDNNAASSIQLTVKGGTQ